MTGNAYIDGAIILGVVAIIVYALAKNRSFAVSIKDWFSFEAKDPPAPPPARVRNIDVLKGARLTKVEADAVIGRSGSGRGAPASTDVGGGSTIRDSKFGRIVGEIESGEDPAER